MFENAKLKATDFRELIERDGACVKKWNAPFEAAGQGARSFLGSGKLMIDDQDMFGHNANQTFEVRKVNKRKRMLMPNPEPEEVEADATVAVHALKITILEEDLIGKNRQLGETDAAKVRAEADTVTCKRKFAKACETIRFNEGVTEMQSNINNAARKFLDEDMKATAENDNRKLRRMRQHQ